MAHYYEQNGESGRGLSPAISFTPPKKKVRARSLSLEASHPTFCKNGRPSVGPFAGKGRQSRISLFPLFLISPLFYRHKNPADDQCSADEDVGSQGFAEGEDAGEEIGRASCRERV